MTNRMIWTPGETFRFDGDEDDIGAEETQKKRYRMWRLLEPLLPQLQRIYASGPDSDLDQRLIQSILGLAIIEIASRARGL